MRDDHDIAIREAIRSKYSEIAVAEKRGCSCGSGCCGSNGAITPSTLASTVGYSAQELQDAPHGANMGLGCGNPHAIAALQPGEVVVDLGSGGGFDCFLAAKQVGGRGRVIGVDMTPEMVERARRNATATQYGNVSFRLGEIEYLPVPDGIADAVLSNCVVNLSTDKAQVFREAYRVLKRGGRLALSDIVATADIPEAIRKDLELHAACIAGAARVEDIEKMMQQAGFTNISIRPSLQSGKLLAEMFPALGVENVVASAVIEAVKQ